VIFAGLGDKERTLEGRINLYERIRATSLRMQGAYQQAGRLAAQAVAINQQLNRPQGIAASLHNQAEILYANAKPTLTTAIKAYKVALAHQFMETVSDTAELLGQCGEGCRPCLETGPPGLRSMIHIAPNFGVGQSLATLRALTYCRSYSGSGLPRVPLVACGRVSCLPRATLAILRIFRGRLADMAF
jgi:hypothetical protein